MTCKFIHQITCIDWLEELRSDLPLNKVIICLNSEVDTNGFVQEVEICDGWLWAPKWVLMHASCIEQKLLQKAVVLLESNGLSCLDSSTAISKHMSAEIEARFIHSDYFSNKTSDFAILAIDNEYKLDKPSYPYITTILKDYYKYITEVFEHLRLEGTIIQRTKKLEIRTDPLILFTNAVILPIVVFILSFLLITFCTGTLEPEVAYKYKKIEDYKETQDFHETNSNIPTAVTNKKCRGSRQNDEFQNLCDIYDKIEYYV